MKKIVLIVMDGLGDRPIASLGNRTPLQAAFRPGMNTMARDGITGLMFPVSQGIRSGSDTSHLSILGYDTVKVYTGRGPFEAMGLGMDVRKGDVAFRANFASRSKDGKIEDRRAGRLSENTEEICSAISMVLDGVQFTVKPGVEHRAALVMHGPGLSEKVTDSDPHEAGLPPCEVKPMDSDASRTAELLNRYLSKVREILDKHPFNVKRSGKGEPPANELLIRGAGKAPEIEDFNQKYGMKGACVVGIPMIAGICGLAGMDVIKAPGVTGRVDSDYESKIRTTISALRDHDFVLVNVKGPDIAGHDRNPELKRDVIEKADRAFRQLLGLKGEVVVAVTGDHSTPCTYADHSGDPVPLLIYAGGNRVDPSERFDEVSCVSGSLRIQSGDLMQYLLNVSDRAEKYGA